MTELAGLISEDQTLRGTLPGQTLQGQTPQSQTLRGTLQGQTLQGQTPRSHALRGRLDITYAERIGNILPPRGSALAGYSWEEISKISTYGMAKDYFYVGDTKDITMTTGEVITMQIIGFDHDTKKDGATAGITFQMRDLLATKWVMFRSSQLSIVAWRRSNIRDRLCGNFDSDIYNALPNEVKNVILPIVKTTGTYEGTAGETYHQTTELAFLLSEIEIYGVCKYSLSGEGKQYAYYANPVNRKVKYLANGAGQSCMWWTRSPRYSEPPYFCGVYTNGYANYMYGYYEYGVSFAFCV